MKLINKRVALFTAKLTSQPWLEKKKIEQKRLSWERRNHNKHDFPFVLDTPRRSLPDGRAQLVRGSQGLEDPVALGPPLPGEGAGESFGKSGRRSGPGESSARGLRGFPGST